MLGSSQALVSRFVAHPALVGLGKSSYEAIFLCGPLLLGGDVPKRLAGCEKKLRLEMCGQTLGPDFQRSAPGPAPNILFFDPTVTDDRR